MINEGKSAAKNTFMLYLMNIAKMLFPLITLPYLTRVLSVDCYGVVSYVKAVMQYIQLLLIFGFTLSATKDIVKAYGDKEKIGNITADVMVAKCILATLSAVFLIVFSIFVPILRQNPLYTFLSFVNIFITEMLADFMFRGIDKMEVITIRFVVAKTISTLCTFVFIKGDQDFLLIPVFDIIGSFVALLLVMFEIKKLGISLKFTGLKSSIAKLKESAVYFASDMATTAFGALNTLLIGIFIDTAQVAYWSLCMQLVGAVQSMYTPITNGIYPTMIRTKSLKFIKKISLIFMPLVIVGCIFCFFAAHYILLIVGGNQYTAAVPVFRALIPVMLFSFPGMLFGWSTLGPIGKQKQTTMTTIITAVIQVLGLVLLIMLNQFTLVYIAILRGLTELLMLILRLSVCIRYKKEFNA
ncbi:MAG: oligosaccharide flippase family protein [Absicoccus porci]|uniref:oligosaccharide flippase family protein n=1 Tax=Absicoccus porci TaxID=2486576 RepID=UPI0023F13928|nr:oligosaccharide flippase family protein [Absicoccus porci]MDD7331048.1 oligosaccharide flippase family protein [Absicoccus porci]MDY4738008.1 oligosaccharide flippase family protein [Absicoccus porci]